MSGFLGGLRSGWDAVTGFVGGIADWIAANKGPIAKDRRILKPAGAAIMTGFVDSLRDQMPGLAAWADDATGIVAGIGDVRPSVAGVDGLDGLDDRTDTRASQVIQKIYRITVEAGLSDPVAIAREIKRLLALLDAVEGVPA